MQIDQAKLLKEFEIRCQYISAKNSSCILCQLSKLCTTRKILLNFDSNSIIFEWRKLCATFPIELKHNRIIDIASGVLIW